MAQPKSTIAMVVIAAAMSLVTASHVLAEVAEPRVRKNIDSLTQDELSNYLHALDIVMQRDPTTVGSYSYYAALHNDGSVGPCEHQRETFLPWHRAHLYEFENELRAADPPRTSNVTIPYWNWSELPSGVRFPKAFENETLLKRDRNTDPVCKTTPNPSCQQLPYPWSDIEANVLSVDPWSTPGVKNFGSYSSNQAVLCAERDDGGYGELEQPPHNTMHGFIGGDMAHPATAAEDPIYWSFHAYIDLLWWEWQKDKNHVVDTCLDCKTCGLNWTIKQVVDSEVQLRVKYEFMRPTAVIASAESADPAFAPLASVDLALSAKQEMASRQITLLTIPSKSVTRAEGTIHDISISSPISFQFNAFLYPQSEAGAFDPKARSARAARMVYLGTVWEQHHAHTGMNRRTQNFRVDLTARLNALVADHAGETWVFDVRTYEDPSSAANALVAGPARRSEVLKFGGASVTME